MIETVHDPWGTGKNVIVVGSSDLKGVRIGMGKFFDLLQGEEDIFLDRTILVEVSDNWKAHKFPKRPLKRIWINQASKLRFGSMLA